MKIGTARLAALIGVVLLITTLAFAGSGRVAYAQENCANWTGYYWNNQTFTGNPTVTRVDSSVNFNWGTGSPDTNIPSDHFSVRWYNTINFGGGTYRFRAGAEDGIRVAIDGTLVINRFSDTSTFIINTADVQLGAGNHTIIIDFYNNVGPAGIQFDWSTLSGSPATCAAPPAQGSAPTPVPAVAAPIQPTFTIKAEVRVSLANVRAAASADSGLLARVKFGKLLGVVATNSVHTWFLVNLPNGTQGWMFRHTLYLYGGNPNQLLISNAVMSQTPIIVRVQGVAATQMLVRDGPSKKNTAKIGVIDEGVSFEILKLSLNNAWVFIDYNGLRGWVFLPNVKVVYGTVGDLPVANQ